MPDFTRAGRYILKDFASGRLLYCNGPRGTKGGAYCAGFSSQGDVIDKHTIAGNSGAMNVSPEEYALLEEQHKAQSKAALENSPQIISLDEDDGIEIPAPSTENRKQKQNRRPDYKFHNKVWANMRVPRSSYMCVSYIHFLDSLR